MITWVPEETLKNTEKFEAKNKTDAKSKTSKTSGAARMRPKRPWPPQSKLAKIFTGALYQFSTVRKQTEVTVGLKMTSVTVDVIDWPLSKEILCCASVQDHCRDLDLC